MTQSMHFNELFFPCQIEKKELGKNAHYYGIYHYLYFLEAFNDRANQKYVTSKLLVHRVRTD